MTDDLTIKVAGLNTMRSSLRALDRGAPKMVRLALNGVVDLLISKIRPQIPRRTGAAAGSLRAASTQGAARIQAGGRRAPWYPWLDFGGRVGRNKATKRAFYRQGRYIFPTLARERDLVEGAMRTALVKLATSSGLDVT